MRIAYWTSALCPEMEAVASEVALLRRSFPGSIAWGISSSQWLQVSWRRGFGVHPRLHWAFRGATGLLQTAFSINHIFGSLGDWFHLKAAWRRPTVLTVATGTRPCDLALLDRVDRFVVEWPAARDDLAALGIGAERIRLIYPPVDLDRFRPAPAPEGPFTLLFASSPERADWLAGRGVLLLLDAAQALPSCRFRLLWRPWGDALPSLYEEIRRRGLTNVEVAVGRFADMPSQYADAHVTVLPFVDPSRCKPAPNSLAESLACGRPVVATRMVGLAEMVENEQGGVVCEATVESMVQAIERVRAKWGRLNGAARLLAEKHFLEGRFVRAYSEIYGELT